MCLCEPTVANHCSVSFVWIWFSFAFILHARYLSSQTGSVWMNGVALFYVNASATICGRFSWTNLRFGCVFHKMLCQEAHTEWEEDTNKNRFQIYCLANVQVHSAFHFDAVAPLLFMSVCARVFVFRLFWTWNELCCSKICKRQPLWLSVCVCVFVHWIRRWNKNIREIDYKIRWIMGMHCMKTARWSGLRLRLAHEVIDSL